MRHITLYTFAFLAPILLALLAPVGTWAQDCSSKTKTGMATGSARTSTCPATTDALREASQRAAFDAASAAAALCEQGSPLAPGGSTGGTRR
jgi:hypothetical protein